MWGKIVKLACVVVSCILSTNLLFVVFCLITNIAYKFNVFSCILFPAVLGIFVIAIMDSATVGEKEAERLNKKVDKEILDANVKTEGIIENGVDTDE